MARASLTVRSQHEADALRLALEHPAVKAAAVITGQLLQLPAALRPQVMHIVESQLVLSLTLFDVVDERPDVAGNGSDPGELLRLLDGTGDTGE